MLQSLFHQRANFAFTPANVVFGGVMLRQPANVAVEAPHYFLGHIDIVAQRQLAVGLKFGDQIL